MIISENIYATSKVWPIVYNTEVLTFDFLAYLFFTLEHSIPLYFNYGVGDGTRTHDSLLKRQVLYQLSYTDI